MKRNLFFIQLTILLFCNAVLAADDLIARVKEAVERNNEIAGVFLKASFDDSEATGQIEYHKLNKCVYYSGEWFQGETKAERDRKKDEYAILRRECGHDVPRWESYDGTLSYSFWPYNFNLEIRPTHTMIYSASSAIGQFDPANWFGLLKEASVAHVLPVAVEIDCPTKGLRRLQHTLSPPGAYETITIDVSPELGYHMVNVTTSGGVWGETNTAIEWKLAEGTYYPAKGRVLRDKRIERWEISEITFDLTKVRKDFGYDELQLPFGTAIRKFDPTLGDSRIKYVCGKEGEKEHQYRSQWMRLKENQKSD